MPTPPWESCKQESFIHFFIRTAFRTVKNDWVRKTNLAGVVLIGFYGLGLAAKNVIAGDSSAGLVNLVFSAACSRRAACDCGQPLATQVGYC